MSFSIKIEEYAPLADIVLANYTRDFTAIKTRYPKLNDAFKTSFTNKLAAVKSQEKAMVVSEQRKAITKSLYEEADALVEELIFVKDYIKDAGLENNIVTALIHDLRSHNIEGACEKIATLKQYILVNKTAIEAEGMAATFPVALETNRISLAKKNKDQKTTSDSGIVLTGKNNSQYTDLYTDIINISDKARKVFKNTPFEDQYVISKILQSMRSSKKGSGLNPTPPTT
jgi:predicted Mrr-cat superfamily restriction endonuclease